EVIEKYPEREGNAFPKNFKRPLPDTDKLYESAPAFSSEANSSSAGSENNYTLVERRRQSTSEPDPKIHYGVIASGSKVIKDATTRDDMSEKFGVLCFEMEAALLAKELKCKSLVIRGIADYADGHKNDEWQGYAAMTAAAYAKVFLDNIDR